MRDILKQIIGKELITGKQASELLGWNPSALRQLVMKEKIESALVGHTLLYDVQDIVELKGGK